MNKTLNILNAAAASKEICNIRYTDSKGKVTERDVIVDEVNEAKGIVRVYTDGGFRNFTIANIG